MTRFLAQSSSFWMPLRASSFADQVDNLFLFILGICTFFFLLIVVLMVVFVVRYRKRAGHKAVKTTTHSTALELTWTIIPLILVVVIFVVGFRGYMDMATPPANAYPIEVIAFKWDWAFRYPNGHVSDDLHIPVDTPIRITLSSQDVIHSFYVPAFRIKKDAVPGRLNQAWFQATQVNDQPGEGYDLFCAEYCGTNHSEMLAKVYVHDAAGFKAWLDQASNWEGRITPRDRGQQLHTQKGCVQCHSIDGTMVVGPSFKNLWDRAAQGTTGFSDGTSLAGLLGPDYSPEDYIRESIYEPDKHKVAGYAQVAMPSFRGLLKENDVLAMIAYLKSLSDSYDPSLESGMEPSAPAAVTQPVEPATDAATQPGDAAP